MRGGGEKGDRKSDRDEDRDVEMELRGERARPGAEADEELRIEPDAKLERPGSADGGERADPQHVERRKHRGRPNEKQPCATRAVAPAFAEEAQGLLHQALFLV